MLGFNLIQKNHSRQFSFTPFYYKKQGEEEGEEPGKHRIKFKRITTQVISSKQALKIKVVFAILLILFLFYFRGLVETEKRNFRIEDVKIEETTSIN